jgi:hypothetical protein
MNATLLAVRWERIEMDDVLFGALVVCMVLVSWYGAGRLGREHGRAFARWVRERGDR